MLSWVEITCMFNGINFDIGAQSMGKSGRDTDKTTQVFLNFVVHMRTKKSLEV